jgi:hypothetical protein
MKEKRKTNWTIKIKKIMLAFLSFWKETETEVLLTKIFVRIKVESRQRASYESPVL